MSVQIFEIIQAGLRKVASNKGLKGLTKSGYWSDYRMAQALGVSQIHYSRLKKRTGRTSPQLLIKLAELAKSELGLSRKDFWEMFEESEK